MNWWVGEMIIQKWPPFSLEIENDFNRNQQRMEFTKDIAQAYQAEVVEIYSKGKSGIEKALYLIHLTDWVSYYISELRKVDATEVDVITRLKNELAQQPLN